MADLTFGEPLHLLENREYSPWVRASFGNFKLVVITSVLRRWPAMTTLLSYLTPKNIQNMRKNHIANSIASVDKRLARKTDRPDVWTYILKHSDGNDDSKRLLPSEMYSNAGLFMTAGTETTATELSGLTYYLLKHPEKMERLKKEVRGAFSSFADIHMGKLAELPYLNAVIEEGLRIYPPVPQLLLRKVVKGGAKVDGNFVPEGVSHSLF
jgi:cytochrome P450